MNLHQAESILRSRILDDSPIEAALGVLAARPSGVARLLDLAHDPEAQVAWLGVEGLARARPHSGLRWAVAAVFARAIRSGRTAVRRAAVWGMIEHGLQPLTREALTQVLGDRDATVCTLAAHGLGVVVEPELAVRQWTALRPLFDAEMPGVRARAYDAAGAARLRPLAGPLRDAITLESPALAERARVALRRVQVGDLEPLSLFDPWYAPVRPQTHRRLKGALTTHPRDRGREVGFLTSPLIDDARVQAALAHLGETAPADEPRAQLVERVVRPREAPVVPADRATPHRVSINALIEWACSGLESAALGTEPQS